MAVHPTVNPRVQNLKAQGDKFYEDRDYAAALDCYSEALQDVEDPVVLSNRSATHAQRRAFDKALDDADRALTLQAQWPRLYHRRGHALFHLGRYVEALEAFEHGLELSPADEFLSQALSLAKEYTEPDPNASVTTNDAAEQAIPKNVRPGAYSTQTVKPTPTAPPAEASKPSAPKLTGPLGSYRVVHTRVVVRQTHSVKANPLKILDKGSKVMGAPHDVDGEPWLKVDAGWMLIDGKSVGLGLLLERDESSSARNSAGDEMREKGNNLFREKKYKAAVEAYSEAISVDRKDERIWANRAAAKIGLLTDLSGTQPPSTLRFNSNFQSALDDLEEALALNMAYGRAWARKGQLYSLVEDKEEALAAYEKGLKLDPSSTDCQAGRDALKQSR